MSNQVPTRLYGAGIGTASTKSFIELFLDRDPTDQDITGAGAPLQIGQRWWNTTSNEEWVLVAFVSSSGYVVADWQKVNSGPSNLETLTGNTGGEVPPTNGNINVVGDGTTVSVAGNPATSTLTISVIGTGETLTGDTGGAVPPTSGNINVIAGVLTRNSGSTVSIIGTPLNSTLTLDVTDANANTFIGEESGTSSHAGTYNTALGTLSMTLSTSGDTNVAIGGNCLNQLVSGSNNTAVGGGAGSSYTGSESSNVIIGNVGTVGDGNTIRIGTYGSGAGQQQNCFIAAAYTNITPGNNNSFGGENAPNAGGSNVTGDRNTGFGWENSFDLTSGDDNCAFGQDCLSSLTTGNNNTAIGSDSLISLETGSYNTALGMQSGSSYTTTESNNIVIGNTGTIADANTIRIGTQGSGDGQQNKAFMAGITGVTVSNAAFVQLDTTTGQLGVTSSSPSSVSINMQVFTSSGTYTPTSGMVYCIIEGVGGGGGGGGTSDCNLNQVSAGGGGGGGGYARLLASASTIGASQVVTIGSGGTAGTSSGGTGGAGGDSSVGSILIAKGGSGGLGSTASSSTNTEGGDGGIAGTGTFTFVGSAGEDGISTVAGNIGNFSCGGGGGNSYFGGSINSNSTVSGQGAGINGSVYGGGGSGGSTSPSGSGVAGGTGAAGFILITEYI